MDTVQHNRRTLLKFPLLLPCAWIPAECGATNLASTPANTPARLPLARRIGDLNPPDQHGIQLADGFRSRIIARSGEPVLPGHQFRWHSSPDGGGCIAHPDGGWVYVSNSEAQTGGASVIHFDVQGRILGARTILRGTSRNCAGGMTPWGSWLSCEEIESGQVWECDPFGKRKARPLPALGTGAREAACVDPVRRQLYLTEDRRDGGLYRYTPASVRKHHYDLDQGRLEIATGEGERLQWKTIDDPQALRRAMRYQHRNTRRFNGGEGLDYYKDHIYFTTKGDNRVWRYHVTRQQLTIVYDAADFQHPVLTGVDNLTVSAQGDILVAEDGGNLEVCVLDPEPQHAPRPLLRIPGHSASEIAGIAFNPVGDRLYLSSQRGESGNGENGISYEVQGPFLNPR